MKYIKNRAVQLTGRARHYAAVARALVVDTEGGHTTVAHFLCGENPWGFHNDMRFSMPVGNVRRGVRISAAAKYVLQDPDSFIVLSNEDYEVLLSAVADPRKPIGELPIPPILAREILPLVDAIESAEERAS